MKPPIILKTILDICFFLLLLGLLSPLLATLISLVLDTPLPLEINDRVEETFSLWTVLLFIADFLVSALSVYVIYLIRKLVRSFFSNRFFTRLQVSMFKLIGQLIIASTLAKLLINIFSILVLEGEGRMNISVESTLDNLLFILAIGLFFIYLGKLFENARSLKEENELTV